MLARRRLLILQFGDYAEAYRRLSGGGEETYRDQRLSVDFVAALSSHFEVTTLAACDRPHHETLRPGLHSIGASIRQVYDRRWLRTQLDALAPDLFVCRAPNSPALTWAADRRVPTLPVFADLFSRSGIRNRIQNFRLAKALRRCQKPCVANHGLTAAHSMSLLGVPSDEIVPWEWRRLQAVGDGKSHPGDRPFRIFFAGMLLETKGIGDCIEAVALLKQSGVLVELTLVGPGATEPWNTMARRLGVDQLVHLPGVISTDRVLEKMREHDVVVVPSRHDYAEGLPNTIFEALASRSPLIISDHPAFKSRLPHGQAVLQFTAGSPRSLADQLQVLINQPERYAELSRGSAAALGSLYVGMDWSELLNGFLSDPLNQTRWTREFTLSAIASRRA